MPPCLVGMEACVGAHHLSRQLLALGHDVKLVPGQFVKPFLKGQKNAATPKPWLRPYNVPPCASSPPRVSTSSTYRRCIGFLRA